MICCWWIILFIDIFVTSYSVKFLASMFFYSLITICLISFCQPIRVSTTESAWNIRTSPIINSPLTASQRSLPAIKIDPKGNIYTTQILKQQLSNELQLPLRDLRVVDPSLPKQIQATFTSRPKAILFCIENIKVIVQHNEALIFSPYQPEVKEMIPALQQLLSQASAASSSSSSSSISTSPSSTATTATVTANSLGRARFEHLVIEAALNVVCTNLFRQVRELSPAVASTLNGLRAESRGLDVVQTQVDELLPQKNKLDELRKRVKEVRRAITDILNNDEDMAMMYLSPSSDSPATYAGSSSTTLDFGIEVNSTTIHPAATATENENMAYRTGSNLNDEQYSSTSSSSTIYQNRVTYDTKSKAIPFSWRGSTNRLKSNNDNSESENSNGNSNNNGNGNNSNNNNNHHHHQYQQHNKPTTVVDTMGLEMLFENYLNEVEWIASEIEEIIDEVTNTEEYVVLQLDLLRNRILRFELLLTVSSFVVTCGALITGVFGMNLLNHFELNKRMFYVVLVFIVGGMGATFSKITRYGRKEKLF